MIYDAGAEAFLATGQYFRHHWYLRIVARELGSGTAFPVGYWTGNEETTVAPFGVSQLYFPAAGALQVPQLIYGSGTNIRSTSFGMAVLEEAEGIIRGYDVEQASVVLTCGIWGLDDNLFKGFGRALKGYVDGAPITTPPKNGTASLTLQCVTTARDGTLMNGGQKSNASQIRRNGSDRFREFAAVTGAANDTWAGEDEAA